VSTPSTVKYDTWTANPTVKTNGNIFTVSYHFDAQNYYGAMVRCNYTCKMKYVGSGSSYELYDGYGYLNFKILSLVINGQKIYP